MMGTSEFSRLVDRLYEGALDPAIWHDSLADLIGSLGGHRGGLFIHDMRDFGCLDQTLIAIDPDYRQSYAGLACRTDMVPLYGKVVAAMPSNGIMTDAMNVARKELEDTALYQEWLHPQRMHRYLQAHFMPKLPTAGMLAIAREAGEAEFDIDAVRTLEAIRPHLQRAVQVRGRLALEKACSVAACSALDSVEQGVLLVAANGVVLHENASATAVLRAGDGLRLDSGILVGDHADTTRALLRLVGGSATGLGTGGHLAVRRRSGRRPLSLLVAPLRGEQQWLPVPPATAIVLIADPERAPITDAQQLRELYGLTPAEARVASALVDSDRLQDVADRLGVSLSAVRIHLQRVFDKTDTHRQAELVRLLMAHRLPTLQFQDT